MLGSMQRVWIGSRPKQCAFIALLFVFLFTAVAHAKDSFSLWENALPAPADPVRDVIQQPTDNSCVQACGTMLLKDRGLPANVANEIGGFNPNNRPTYMDQAAQQ